MSHPNRARCPVLRRCGSAAYFLDGGNFHVNTAETPFEFVTVSYLTRIGNQSAGTLAELLTGLENCSDASIFHHTYQTLGSHHFLTEGFSNDFAHGFFRTPTGTTWRSS